MAETTADETAATTGKAVVMRFAGSGKLDKVVMCGMPKSLPELQHIAAQNFGHSGCLRLFHHGTSLLYHPCQMKEIEDGDTIVVRKSDCFRPVAAETPLSTHQADYLKRPYQRPRTGNGDDYESTLTDGTKGDRMDNMSRYATDFVRHPIEPRVPFKPPSALHLTKEGTGTTTYSREFPWRETNARKALIDDRAVRESSLSLASQKEPFQGSSSYTIDYPRRPLTAPEPIAFDAARESLQPLPTPFDGVTTYASDFQKLKYRKQRSAKPAAAQELIAATFTGTTEYRRTYHEFGFGADRSEHIKLCEEAFQGQDAKEICESVEDAVRQSRHAAALNVPEDSWLRSMKLADGVSDERREVPA